MGILFDDSDNQDFLSEFAIDCYYHQGRLSAEMLNGVTKMNSGAIQGFRYSAPIEEKVIRQAIGYHIVNTPGGRIFEGGARFTIFPTYTDNNGDVRTSVIHERIFKGDILVPKSAPGGANVSIRDFDVLRKGKRDLIFAFDVKSILSVSSVAIDKSETLYRYGIDYTVRVNGTALPVSVLADGTVKLLAADPMPVISDVEVYWLSSAKPLDDQEYSVEFTCSPNYVIWDDMARPRATADNPLPKTVMAVKRAFFNQTENPIATADTEQPILDSFPTSQDITIAP